MRGASPTDQLGIPLPLLGELSRAGGSDDNHHHFHPGADFKDRDLDEGLSAIRASRIQLVSRKLHTRYHRMYWGVVPPQTRSDRLNLVVLSASGYIPDRGTHFKRFYAEPKLSMISPKTRRALWESGQIRISLGNGAVRSFLYSELKSRSVDTNQKGLIIEELLGSNDQQRRIEIARLILGDSARLALEPIAEDWRKAWRDKKLPRAILRGKRLFSISSDPVRTVWAHSISHLDPSKVAEDLGTSLNS